MARKKTSLVAIADASASRSTYKKRKETLIKKTSELSKLCGVDACIVIYGPHDREPDVWPSRENTMQILSRFGCMPEVQRNRNMLDQKGILSKQVEKLQVELRQVEEENCRLEATILLHDVLAGQCTLADVVDVGRMPRLSAMAEERLNEVRERMNELLCVPQSVGPLEEVLLQASLPQPSADMTLLWQEQCNFGLTGADVAPQVYKQYTVGLKSTDVSSPEQEQYMVGLPSNDVASPMHNRYIFGFDSADMAPPKQNQCLFGLASADMAPLLGEQLSLPNLYAVVDSSNSKEGYGTESADVANVPFGPEAEDEISQLFDCSSSGFEDILAYI